ncbi:dTDP-glucose 4,6-dehydratase [Asanoa siamensis]|uniref:dTDP-glucose 4,6-dehydratase n=2 Tax=Asanoa siamensis TaxID=926357 RepID=A0ABQ4CRX8_9ACTN|nr:dTDP-glucose 4,6-dehydratase [Asanoa siamensis]
MLVARGHEVFATTRDAAKAERLGATAVVLDPLDRDAVRAAVRDAAPDVVVHQLTALSGTFDLKHFDRFFQQTNVLRTRGLDILLDAAVAAGARRFVAQGYTGWSNARTGGPVKTEADPLDPTPTRASRESLAAIRHIEATVPHTPGIEGIVLRYGSFYGPDNTLGKGGEMAEMIAKRRLPVVGAGTGVWSFIHIDDAARATVLAIESDRTGVYNIVDDEPVPVREWLPYVANVLGARAPMRVPVWLAKMLIGEHGVSMMTKVRGSSNAKASRELGWKPSYPTWRDGFRREFAG